MNTTLSDNYKKVVSSGGIETLNRLLTVANTNLLALTDNEILNHFNHALEYTRLIEGKNRLGANGTRKYNTQRKFEYTLMRHLVDEIISFYWSVNVVKMYKEIKKINFLLYTTGLSFDKKELEGHQP